MGEIKQSIRVNGLRINALLDSGATENYLSLSVSKKIKLVLGKTYYFRGIDGLKHKGRISYVWIDVADRGGSTKVVVTNLLPQDNYHIVLGQTFLQDNEVILNFKKDKFKFGGHQPRMRKVGRI